MDHAIDKAYKVVQTILNENQHWTLSPTRFNLLAYNAQQVVFSEAINFMKKLKLKDTQRRADKDYLKLYQEALANLFVRDEELTSEPENILGGTRTVYPKPTEVAYVNSAVCSGSDGKIREAEIVPINSGIGLSGHLMTPTEAFPLVIDKRDKYEVLPESVTGLYLYYYRYPKAPMWTYVTTNNLTVFDSTSSEYQDLEVGVELLDDIILHILQDAGMYLRRMDVVEYTQNEETYKDQQEIQ